MQTTVEYAAPQDLFGSCSETQTMAKETSAEHGRLISALRDRLTEQSPREVVLLADGFRPGSTVAVHGEITAVGGRTVRFSDAVTFPLAKVRGIGFKPQAPL